MKRLHKILKAEFLFVLFLFSFSIMSAPPDGFECWPMMDATCPTDYEVEFQRWGKIAYPTSPPNNLVNYEKTTAHDSNLIWFFQESSNNGHVKSELTVPQSTVIVTSDLIMIKKATSSIDTDYRAWARLYCCKKKIP